MPTENKYATSHLAGDCSDPNNALGVDDGTFTTGSDNIDWTSRWAMDDPSDAITGNQNINVIARKDASGGGTPTIAINLYESGALIGPVLAATDITAADSQTITGSFDATSVTNINSVEMELVELGNGGGPNGRMAQIDNIHWLVNLIEPMVVNSVVIQETIFPIVDLKFSDFYKRIDENFLVTDSKFSSLYKVIGETEYPIIDSRRSNLYKIIIDQEYPIENVGGGTDIFLQWTLNIGAREDLITDSSSTILSKVLGETQLVSDTLALILLKLIAEFQRPISDDVSTSQITGLLTQDVQEVQDILDNFSFILSKVIPESEDISDIFSRVLNSIITDQQDINDSFSRLLSKDIPDTVLISDVINKNFSKTISENQILLDSYFLTLLKLILENQDPIIDSVDVSTIVGLIVRSLSDNIDISDQFNSLFLKVVSEQEDISDAYNLLLLKLITDTQFPITDDVTASAIVGLITRSLQESIDLEDSFSSILYKNVSESEDISDTYQEILLKILTETQLVSDTVDASTIVGLIIQSIQDTLDISDAFSMSLSKTVSEELIISDIYQLILLKFLEDSQGLNDAFQKILLKNISDSQDITDLLATILFHTILVTEQIDFSDNSTKNIFLILLDNLLISDDVIKSLAKVLTENQYPITDEATVTFISGLAKVTHFLSGIESDIKFQENISDIKDIAGEIKGISDLLDFIIDIKE